MRKILSIGALFYLLFQMQSIECSYANDHASGMYAEPEQVRAKIHVTGVVLDVNKVPIVGAVILEKESGNGTVANLDGVFSISVSANAILQFSMLGYVSQELPADQNSEMTIVLQEDATQVDEVVVVGYATQRKANLSGAVDLVNTKKLETRPITDVSRGIQGLVPNLNIDFNSGEPGKAANINIRGASSINGGSPLILIDGVPSSSEELSRLLPNDIESISVLKDAASAAIYGARAAFGVILIVTKQGKGDRIQVGYNNIFSWERPTVLPQKTADPYIYLKLKNIAVLNTPWSAGHVSSDERLEWARQRSDNPSTTEAVRLNPLDETQWDYMGNQDWTRYFLDKLTFSNSHQVSASGSSEKSNYYLSGGYDNQNGILSNVVKDDNFTRYNLRTKASYKIRDWFTLMNNTSFVTTTRIKPSYYSNMGIFYNLAPTDHDINPDGTWANSGAGTTLAQLIDGGKENTEYNRIQSILSAEMRFLKGDLKVNTNYSFTQGGEDYSWYKNKYRIGYGPNDIRELGESRAYRSRTQENYNMLELFANYNKTLGKHYLGGVLGYNTENSKWKWFSAEREGIISPSLPSIGLASGNQLVDEKYKDWAIQGVFYRVNYIYNNRYIVEFNGRYDGTSRFPKHQRFGFFPSASVAWRMEEESFFEPLRDAVDQLKIRASYGSLGNQLVSEYGYIATMSSGQGSYLIDGNRPQIVTTPGLVSDNYTWETVTTKNIGIDLGFLNNKLTSTFDLYRRDTKNMLMPGKELPAVLGAAVPRENAASMKTTGWELSLSYNDEFSVASKPFTLGLKFILSDNRSWITKFDNPSKSLTQYYVGQELGEIWGLKSDGFFQNSDQISQLDQSDIVPWGALDIVPGWPRYQDMNGDGRINKGSVTVNDPGDLVKIGNTSPRYRFGFNLNAEWNGFDFLAILQGVGKRDYYPLSYLYWGFYQQPYAGGVTHLFDFYRPESDGEVDREKHSQAYINAGLADQNLNARYPVLQAWMADKNLGTTIDKSMGLAIPQSNYLLNAAYLRLQNITIGYSLPQKWIEKTGLAKARIYISGDNLYEWSALRKYFDPEAITDEGQYGYVYPFNRQYSMGINIIF